MPIREKLHSMLLGSAGSMRAAHRSSMVVERMEPRILHSADPASVFASDAPLAAQVEQRVLAPEPPSAPAPLAQTEQAHAHELVFVDPRTPNYQQLVNDIRSEAADGRNIEVILLDSRSDGVAQITAYLSGCKDVSAIHLISHGSNGAVQIGNSTLDAQTLGRYESELHSWSAALAPGADLLIYGCDVAESAGGRAFVDALGHATGTNVAASENLTGDARLGGDWTLEYATGPIEASMAIDTQTQAQYSGLLAISVGNSSSSMTTGASSLTFAQTFASGSNGLLVVNVSYQANGSNAVTSVTYGGAALTLLGSAQNTTGAHTATEMWILKSPAAGTANVVISMNNSIAFTGGATNFFGVDQTTPTGTFVGATANNHTPSITVSSAPGEVVIDSLAERSASSGTAGAGQTESYHQNTGTAGGDTWGSSSTEAGAASVVMNWSTAGSGNGEWAMAAVSLRPASNSAPSLTGANNLTTINEDPVSNPGTLVSALISGMVTDADVGAFSGIAVTAVDNTNGTWQYSTDSGSTWSNFGTPNTASARLLAADANSYVRFVPNANWNGTVTSGLTFRAWDQTSGLNGGTANTSSVTNTVLDQFNAVSYNNSDGTAFWTAGWVDTDGNPSSGSITVSGGQLNLATLLGSDSIYREANLSGATGATLSFSYNNQLGLLGTVALQASNNGGSSYTTLATFSNLSNTGAGTFSTDISSYIASNTRIQLVMNGTLLGGSLSVDNVQISYLTPPGGSTAFSAATASSSIAVTAANDAPVVTVPAAQTVSTNGQLTFSSAGGNPIVISDLDGGSGSELVSLSVTNGTLTLASTAGLTIVTGTGTADSSVSFTGSLTDINAALDGLHYDPAANFSGSAGLGIAVNDQGNTGSGGPQSATGGVGITVVYTAPAISATGTPLSYTENDTATAIDSGLTLTAGTLGNLGGATVHLSANYATGQDILGFTNQLGISGSWDPVAGKLALSGSASVADYQTALRSVSYQNTSDDPSTANRTVTFSVNDGVSIQSTSRQISVAAVNDAPALSVPASLAVTEDVASAITGISFSDVDAGGASVLATFSVPQGTLAAVSSGGVTVGGSATALTISGSIANINAFLAASNLSYTTAPNDASAVTLGVSIDDQGNTGGGGARSAAGNVTLNVTAVNDAPAGANNTVSTPEDTGYVFASTDFGFTDPNDSPPNALLAVKITTVPGAGTLTLSGTVVSAGQFVSVTDINAGNLVFTPALNANGSGYASFTFQVQDNGGIANGGIDLDPVARTLTIDVSAVNDPPVAAVPGTQSVASNSTLVFSAAGGNALSISDPDAGTSAVQISLSVASGTLSLSGTTGLIFVVGTGSGDASMTFTASIPAINAALDGLMFTPGTGYGGSTLLSVSVNDLGNTGSGGAGSANGSVVIAVLPPVAAGVPSSPMPSIPAPPAVPGTSIAVPGISTPTLPDTPAQAPPPVAATAGSIESAQEATTTQPSRTEEPSTFLADSTPSARASQSALLDTNSSQPSTSGRVSSVAFGGRDLRLLLAAAESPEVALANFALTSRDSPYANQIALASMRSTDLLNELDRLRDGLQEESRGAAHAIALTTAATLGLSVGYVFWLLRGGVLLSTVLSSMPAWRMIDPLPILGRLEDDADDEDDPDESLESLVARENRAAGGGVPGSMPA